MVSFTEEQEAFRETVRRLGRERLRDGYLERAVQAINDCIVLHGQMGYSDELPLSQMLLDVAGLQIGDGTPQIQKLIIARDLLGREHSG